MNRKNPFLSREKDVSLPMSLPPALMELSDEELEAVSGGGLMGYFTASSATQAGTSNIGTTSGLAIGAGSSFGATADTAAYSVDPAGSQGSTGSSSNFGATGSSYGDQPSVVSSGTSFGIGISASNAP